MVRKMLMCNNYCFHMTRACMQPPIERVLGRSYKLAPRSGSMVEVRDYCYDVPLFSSLRALLKCDDVRDQVYAWSPGNILIACALSETVMSCSVLSY